MPRTAMLDRPGGTAVSELLFGEAFEVDEERCGWVHGRSCHDGYQGFLDASALWSATAEPTHRVTARTALVFAAQSIKAPVVARLPMGSRLVASASEDAFLLVDFGDAPPAYVHARHVQPIGQFASDPVVVGSRLLGAPYLWGGRTGEGVDCSGLVQLSLGMCGISAPRDSGPQCTALGRDVAPEDARRGDLVFFAGHVGILVDGTRLLHANAHWMLTVIEPLADVIARATTEGRAPAMWVKRLAYG